MTISEYQKGWNDCKAGEHDNKSQSADYDRGFNYRYQWEQSLTFSADRGCRFARAKV